MGTGRNSAFEMRLLDIIAVGVTQQLGQVLRAFTFLCVVMTLYSSEEVFIDSEL